MSDLGKQFDEINLNTLQLWVETRNSETMPEELAVYTEMLEHVYGWHQSLATEREIINNLLTHYATYFKGDRTSAKQIYADAVNHFYIDATITQEAWANVYADRFDRLAILIIETATTPTDFARAEKAWTQAAQCRGVFADKSNVLPDEFYEKRYNVYTQKLEDLGLQPVNRREIESMIDGLSLPAAVTIDLKQDANVLPKNIFDFNVQEKEN